MQAVTLSVVLVLAMSAVLCDCRDWHVGADQSRGGGAVVHGHANIPLHRDNAGQTHANVHGSQVIGGRDRGQQTVGGGLGYEGRNGIRAGVDASHTRGQGTSIMGTISGRF